MATSDDLYVYINGLTLLRMSINRAETFTFDFDDFREENPFKQNTYNPANSAKCSPPFY